MAYERESLDWSKQYVNGVHTFGEWGQPFVVRTDHWSLKFLLDQRLSIIPQHQWASKLFSFDFSVEYKPGSVNVVADASCKALSTPRLVVFDEIRSEVAAGAEWDEFRAKAEWSADGWRMVDGLLLKDNKVFVPPSSHWANVVITEAHEAGHEGIQKTLHRVRADFYIPRDRKLIQDHE